LPNSAASSAFASLSFSVPLARVSSIPAVSDLDFIVEFPPEYDFGPWLSRLSQFEQSLAHLFGRRVDLIMPSALRNPWFRREADKARLTLYQAT
jgi:predicted nucleotidyltransferase